jgi:integrase
MTEANEKQRRPRRANGEGSLIKLKGCRFYYAQFYDQNGRKIRISTQTEVKQEALGTLRREMGKVRDNGQTPVTDMRKIRYADLRAGLIASYVEKGNKSLTVRATGEETITGLKQLDRFFEYSETNAGPSVVQITSDTARRFVAQRQAENVKSAVINRSLACLRRMLRIAHEDGKIHSVPVIHLLAEPKPRRGFVPVQKFEEMLAKFPARLQPYIFFLYHCGGRRGEAEQIEWSQVDLEHAFIRLEDDQTKTGEARIVPLPKRLVAMLDEIKPKAGRVFDTTNLRKEWMKACAACGLGTIIPVEGKKYDPRYEGLTLHDFRRSAVRNLVTLAGVPERVAMRITGHKTRSVFDRYHIVATEDLTGAMQAWEAATQTLLPLSNGEKLGKKGRPKARKLLMALSSRG